MFSNVKSHIKVSFAMLMKATFGKDLMSVARENNRNKWWGYSAMFPDFLEVERDKRLNLVANV